MKAHWFFFIYFLLSVGKRNTTKKAYCKVKHEWSHMIYRSGCCLFILALSFPCLPQRSSNKCKLVGDRSAAGRSSRTISERCQVQQRVCQRHAACKAGRVLYFKVEAQEYPSTYCSSPVHFSNFGGSNINITWVIFENDFFFIFTQFSFNQISSFVWYKK